MGQRGKHFAQGKQALLTFDEGMYRFRFGDVAEQDELTGSAAERRGGHGDLASTRQGDAVHAGRGWRAAGQRAFHDGTPEDAVQRFSQQCAGGGVAVLDPTRPVDHHHAGRQGIEDAAQFGIFRPLRQARRARELKRWTHTVSPLSLAHAEPASGPVWSPEQIATYMPYFILSFNTKA